MVSVRDGEVLTAPSSRQLSAAFLLVVSLSHDHKDHLYRLSDPSWGVEVGQCPFVKDFLADLVADYEVSQFSSKSRQKSQRMTYCACRTF